MPAKHTYKPERAHSTQCSPSPAPFTQGSHCQQSFICLCAHGDTSCHPIHTEHTNPPTPGRIPRTHGGAHSASNPPSPASLTHTKGNQCYQPLTCRPLDASGRSARPPPPPRPPAAAPPRPPRGARTRAWEAAPSDCFTSRSCGGGACTCGGRIKVTTT
eukprot:1155176-Pelagomonas_calceolata.AAC.2